MAYIKPLSPIKSGEDFIYPLTSYDQIIMEDGSRWDGTLVGSNTVRVDLEDTEEGTPALTNADMLGNKLAEEYVLKNEVEGLTGGIQMELLWENASPESQFAEQVVDVNFDGFAYYMIMYNLHFSYLIYDSTGFVPVGKEARMYRVTNGSNAATGAYRDFFFSTKKFGGSVSLVGGSTNAESCIPYRIYGIKGVS